QRIDHDPDQNTHRMSTQFGRSNSGWLAAVRILGFQSVRQKDIRQAARSLPALPFPGEIYDQEASGKHPDADPYAHAHGHTLANPISRGKMFRDTLRGAATVI